MASISENAPAWAVRRKEIDRFISRIPKRGASAAFIQGPHASGKSTTMVAHILHMVQKLPGARLVYILPTFLEELLLSQYLASEGFNAQLPVTIANRLLPAKTEEDGDPLRHAGSLSIQSYSKALHGFRKHGKFPFFKAGVVVLVDLELNPTTDGELLLGHLLESAHSIRSEAPGCAVITISTFESHRAEVAMDRVIGRPPTVIRTPQGPLPAIPLRRMPEPWRDHVAALSDSPNTPRGSTPERVVIGESHFGVVEDILDRDSLEEADGLSLAREPPALMLANPDLYVSLHVPGLRHSVSRGFVAKEVFNRRTSQALSLTQRMSKMEIMTQQSWLLKSDCPREDVVFHTTYEDFEGRLLGSDPPWLTAEILCGRP